MTLATASCSGVGTSCRLRRRREHHPPPPPPPTPLGVPGQRPRRRPSARECPRRWGGPQAEPRCTPAPEAPATTAAHNKQTMSMVQDREAMGERGKGGGGGRRIHACEAGRTSTHTGTVAPARTHTHGTEQSPCAQRQATATRHTAHLKVWGHTRGHTLHRQPSQHLAPLHLVGGEEHAWPLQLPNKQEHQQDAEAVHVRLLRNPGPIHIIKPEHDSTREWRGGGRKRATAR